MHSTVLDVLGSIHQVQTWMEVEQARLSSFPADAQSDPVSTCVDALATYQDRKWQWEPPTNTNSYRASSTYLKWKMYHTISHSV